MTNTSLNDSCLTNNCTNNTSIDSLFLNISTNSSVINSILIVNTKAFDFGDFYKNFLYFFSDYNSETIIFFEITLLIILFFIYLFYSIFKIRI